MKRKKMRKLIKAELKYSKEQLEIADNNALQAFYRGRMDICYSALDMFKPKKKRLIYG